MRKNCFRAILLTLFFPCILTLTACRGGGQIDENVYWGPIPSKERLAELQQLGVKTIVDCRQRPIRKKRAAARAAAHNMNYVLLKTGLYMSPSEECIDKFVEIIKEPKNCPIYVCDVAAKDRTQFYLAIYRMVKKRWTAEAASYQMYRGGLRHWWPWFYKYKDILKAHEVAFHSECNDTNKTDVAESKSDTLH